MGVLVWSFIRSHMQSPPRKASCHRLGHSKRTASRTIELVHSICTAHATSTACSFQASRKGGTAAYNSFNVNDCVYRYAHFDSFVFPPRVRRPSFFLFVRTLARLASPREQSSR